MDKQTNKKEEKSCDNCKHKPLDTRKPRCMMCWKSKDITDSGYEAEGTSDWDDGAMEGLRKSIKDKQPKATKQENKEKCGEISAKLKYWNCIRAYGVIIRVKRRKYYIPMEVTEKKLSKEEALEICGRINGK